MLPGKQLSVESVLKLLRRHRWLLIAPAFLGVIGGLLYSRAQPSLYRSDAVIQVVPQRVPETYVAATVTERVEDRLRTLSQQVLSRTQIEKLINDFSLFPEERRKYPLEDVVQLMTTRVLIEPLATTQESRRGSQSDAFRVSFDYEDPAVAQKVVEQLARFFVDENLKERNAQAEGTSSFLEAQLKDARGRLEAQELKLKTFRERNAGRLPTQTQANMQAIQNTQMTLQALVASLETDRSRKQVIERLYADAAAEAAAGPPGVVTPQQRLDEARRTLAQMELRLTPKHPDVVRIKRLIEDLERQVAADAAGRPASAEGEAERPPVNAEDARRRDQLRDLKAEVESLTRQIAFKEGEEKRQRGLISQYQSRLEAVPGIESEWIKLTRDYDTLQESYRELLAKSENSKMAANLEQQQIGERFSILDAARLPLKPYKPNRLQINLVGTAAGLALGVFLIGLAYAQDSTMRSEADVAGAVELPVLVVLPFVASEADRRRQQRRRWLEVTALALMLVATAVLGWYLRLWQYVV